MCYYQIIGMKLLPIIVPLRCPVREAAVPFGRAICPSCYRQLPFVGSCTCYSCGKPVSDPGQEYCYDCRVFSKSFLGGCSLLIYDRMTQPAMVRFKYHNQRVLADFFSDEILRRYRSLFRSWKINAVVPVPIHRIKYKKRGYNQAALLSSRIAYGLGLSHISDLLIRKVNTLPQKQFGSQARLANLTDAFSFNKQYSGDVSSIGRLLLVDDIYTTGATMEACTRVLNRAGIKDVYICSVCTGLSRDSQDDSPYNTT